MKWCQLIYLIQCLAGGFFGLDIQERTARLYDDGNAKTSTTTLPHVGCAVTKLLELPVSTLAQYRNKFVYVHSFHVSQMDMLKALEKVTNTEEKDWKITKIPVDEAIEKGRSEVSNGVRKGMIDVLCGMSFKPGAGGNYQDKSANGLLGLAEESLDAIVAEIVSNLE